MRNALLLIPLLLALTGASLPPARGEIAPHASYVTVVVMENRSYDLIVNNANAPYFNQTLVPQGALLKNSHAVAHPSEPNYLALFSGSTHGVPDDRCPLAFSSANIASELAAAGKTFAGWSESMPGDGYAGCYGVLYARKHNPWIDFDNVPATENRVYRGLPATMASVNWIVPNMCNDMHDCSTRTGDRWLSKNLPPIIEWNARNDGLLVVTWDEAEPDRDGTNHIATVFLGPMVRPGTVDVQRVDHYGILHTIEAIFGLPCIDQDCRAAIVTGIWR